ncbi:MAG: galactokinase [Fimbriimonas sp.]
MSAQSATALFETTFGHAPTLVVAAPGRVNLIGEHTDYNDGFVFPAAIDREVWLAVRPCDGTSRLVSAQLGDGQPFDANSVLPKEVEGWTEYAAGMAWVLREFGVLPNIEAAVVSGVPMGSGVSSSAALELAFGVAWRHLAGLAIPQPKLAILAQKCENEFVGLNCGIMDQMASAMGREGFAMFLDTRSLAIRYAPIPEGVSIALCDTKKPRALTASKYNERRTECETAAAALGVKKLRDATLQQLVAHRATLDPVVYRRARHVITEDERSLAFAEALERCDLDSLEALMRGSHQSLRDDYEVSCRELDRMVEAAEQAPGCLGVRMTGAGFGGACVALVRTDQLLAFTNATMQLYEESGRAEQSDFVNGDVLPCQAWSGARVVSD